MLRRGALVKFSTRATYGLKALLYLAQAYHERAVSASQIAKEEGLSPAYLEQILHLLKKKQWVKSLRGPSGGYVLARKPSEVRIGPVLRDLEGKSAVRSKARARGPAVSGNAPSIAAAIFWERAQREYAELLDKPTLKALLDEARELQKQSPASARKLNFNI